MNSRHYIDHTQDTTWKHYDKAAQTAYGEMLAATARNDKAAIADAEERMNIAYSLRDKRARVLMRGGAK